MAIFLWRYRLPGTDTPPNVARFVIPLTEQERQDDVFDSVVMAPDGTRIAIAGTVGGVRHILLRSLQDMSTQVLSGTENASYPFFSPDSQWIGFFADGKLKKVPVGGGAPDVLADALGARGGDWGDSGMIVFSPFARGKGIYEVNADGGDAKPITALDTANGETSHRLPHLLPGGKTLLFAAYGATYDDVNIVAQSLQTGERKILIKGATQPGYVSTGHLLYVQPKLPDTLMAVAFNPAELKLTGPPVPVVNGLLTYGRGSDWTISREGTIVYAPGGLRGTESLLTWVDRKGMVQPSSIPSKPFSHPFISPDGKRIAYNLIAGTSDIWLYDSTAKQQPDLHSQEIMDGRCGLQMAVALFSPPIAPGPGICTGNPPMAAGRRSCCGTIPLASIRRLFHRTASCWLLL